MLSREFLAWSLWVVADQVPLGDGPNSTIVFTDKTTDLRPSNAAAEAFVFSISPDYFRADGDLHDQQQVSQGNPATNANRLHPMC